MLSKDREEPQTGQKEKQNCIITSEVLWSKTRAQNNVRIKVNKKKKELNKMFHMQIEGLRPSFHTEAMTTLKTNKKKKRLT